MRKSRLIIYKLYHYPSGIELFLTFEPDKKDIAKLAEKHGFEYEPGDFVEISLIDIYKR